MIRFIKNGIIKAILLIILIILIIFIFNRPQFINIYENFSFWLFPDNQSRNGELFKIVLSILGAMGILFGLYVSLRRAKAVEKSVLRQKEALEIQNEQIGISRKAQTDERFKNAVEHLGSEKEPIILGGIAELHQIAKENKIEYSEIVFNIFCSYIRSSANIYKKTAEEINTTAIQTIVNNLFKTKNDETETYSRLRANLSHSNLGGINLDYANLTGANFSHSYMPSLKNSNFEETNLSHAIFLLSEITDVSFLGANVHRTLFYSSTLKNIDMSSNTDLLLTVFLESILQNVSFNNTSISSCKFLASDIIDSTFQRSGIVATKFCGSGLKNIKFSNINLFGSNDFRAAGFNNVSIDTVVTQTNFKGCRFGDSYRYSMENSLKNHIGHNTDFKGVKIQKSLLSNCITGMFTQNDFNEILEDYKRCIKMNTISKS